MVLGVKRLASYLLWPFGIIATVIAAILYVPTLIVAVLLGKAFGVDGVDVLNWLLFGDKVGKREPFMVMFRRSRERIADEKSRARSQKAIEILRMKMGQDR